MSFSLSPTKRLVYRSRSEKNTTIVAVPYCQPVMTAGRGYDWVNRSRLQW